MEDVFKNRLDQQHAARIQEEARIANDLQADHPDMTRTEALKIAARLVSRLNSL